MKHTYELTFKSIGESALLAFLVFLLSISFTFAQTETDQRRTRNAIQVQENTREPQTFIEKARETLLQKRQENSKVRAREAEERKVNTARESGEADKAKSERADRIASYLERVSRKMTAAVERLDILSSRIESRINKLEERGIDMTRTKELLEAARVSITEAGESLKTALSDAREALSIDISRDSFGKVVSGLAHAKEKLREAHQTLVEVIRTMKSGLEQNEQKTEDNN